MKILIVENQRLFRKALICLLKVSVDFRIDCDEAQNGREAIHLIRKKKYDLVFLEVSMPIMDGFETCKLLRLEYKDLPIIMLTQFNSERIILHFLKLGVHSFLTKNASLNEVLAALRSVQHGKSYLTASIRAIVRKYKTKSHAGTLKIELTAKEKLLLQLLKEGRTSKEIADEINLRVKSIATYRERLLKKTQTCNVAELISFGYEHGLLNFFKKI